MRKLIFLIAFVIAASLVKAQDLIVTNTNDSLDCRITKVTNDHIYFSYLNNGELRKTLISKKDVKQFTKANPGSNESISVAGDFKPIFSRFRLAVNGGFSNRLGKVAKSDFETYLKDLKKGSNIGVDASYFISESVGFGIKFSSFSANNKLNNVTMDSDGDGLPNNGSISDDITITFVGPGYSTRVVSTNGNAFISSLSIGYLGYLNHSEVINYPFDLKGSTLGIALDLGYDIKLSDRLSIGAQCSLLRGTLTSITQVDGNYSRKIDLDKDEYESLSRLDFSVGLRLNL